MASMILLLLVAGLLSGLAAYARHDRFAGPRNVHTEIDDLGPVHDRIPVRS